MEGLTAHDDDEELRQLADQLIDAAEADDPDREAMAHEAYLNAVERRRAELRDRLEDLELERSMVILDAAIAGGADPAELFRDWSVEKAIESIRQVALEAQDGTERARARQWLEDHGIPVEPDDGDGDGQD